MTPVLHREAQICWFLFQFGVTLHPKKPISCAYQQGCDLQRAIAIPIRHVQADWGLRRRWFWTKTFPESSCAAALLALTIGGRWAVHEFGFITQHIRSSCVARGSTTHTLRAKLQLCTCVCQVAARVCEPRKASATRSPETCTTPHGNHAQTLSERTAARPSNQNSNPGPFTQFIAFCC